MLSQGRENYVFCIISTLTFQVTCRMSLVVWFIDGCALCDGEFRLSLEYENVIILCSCNMNIKNVIVSWIFRMFWSSILLYKEFLKDIPTWKWHWTYSNILEHYKYHSMNMVHWQFSLVIHVTSIYYLSDFLIWLKSLKYTGTNIFKYIFYYYFRFQKLLCDLCFNCKLHEFWFECLQWNETTYSRMLILLMLSSVPIIREYHITSIVLRCCCRIFNQYKKSMTPWQKMAKSLV